VKIIFLSYWGIDEGLAQATVIPHVTMLARRTDVDEIILCTIERNKIHGTWSYDKVTHAPLASKNYGNVYLNKANDFFSFSRQLISLVRKNRVNLMICRSSLAGGIGYLVHRATEVPYMVESYEPHALYMQESGVWKSWDPRFLLERLMQRLQNRTAAFLLPVSSHYAKLLARTGIAERRVITVPCVVDTTSFVRKQGAEIRASLGIDLGAVTGIYVGKFGGLYYDAEAFRIFAAARKVFPNFRLIILTPDPVDRVCFQLRQHGFSDHDCIVKKVLHQEVPRYLSAADFAFATYRPSPSKKFLSPIKVGEYWACGLPVLLTKGVGDDADIIESSGCGAVFSFEENNVEAALRAIARQLNDANVRTMQAALATKYRSVKILEDAYHRILISLTK
jgi:glycosyltransferase involved in cell wall biosynthesis